MIIKKMTATFGRLQNETLELGPGLTVIQAPNEGGKSTWSAFIRAMLYGIPTKERDRQNFIAEKNRYQPWSGAPMEGAMEIRWQGQELLLRRSQNRTVPFGKCEVADPRTGEAVPGFTGENVGELLTGAPREVFERSAFVGQGAAAVDGAPALEKRISALVSSGEEDVSYSQVERRLRDWLNRRRHNRTGLIPKLESALDQLNGTLARQSRAHRSAQEAQRALRALEEEHALLTQELAAHKFAAEQQRRAAWEQAQGELAQARAEETRLQGELCRDGAPPSREALRTVQEGLNELRALDREHRTGEDSLSAAQEGLSAAQAVLEDSIFRGLSPEQARAQAQTDADAAQAQPPAAGPSPVLGVVLLIAGLLCAAAGVLVDPLFFLPGAAALVGGGAAFLISSRRRSALQDFLDGQQEILDRYGVDSPNAILSLAKDYAGDWVRAQEAERALVRAQQDRQQRNQRREQLAGSITRSLDGFGAGLKDVITLSAAISRALLLQEKLEQAVIRREGAEKLAQRLPAPQDLPRPGDLTPRYDAAYTAARLTAVEGEMSRLRSVLATAQGELNTLGDPDETIEQQEQLQEELDRRRGEYDSLSLALEGLEEARRDMQSRFAPALNDRAGALMASLTGGKYDKVLLTQEFDALASEADTVLPRRVLTLSRGAADQLYLAVRLAICELALPLDDPAPLILDDALANFDDARMALALDALQALAQTRQVLLFTCHSREADYLADTPAVKIHLDSQP
ncbi:hypothetical protein D1159_00470 [Pseudoflavonifractor sp. 524-17]|uniref:ATP-binding protein n=1 Tax=Pseudoflavonifractor sp. 524-17 TaxID=2304577 RepID=UPI001379841A|nr:AAA family ATPase [Pseudoflavonifractor sp. 524-17]NCE63085.1 hypothetical protein [Pseudoflavonifractor sp. 524-17]